MNYILIASVAIVSASWGFLAGWKLRAKQLLIITESTVKQGMNNAREDAERRMEEQYEKNQKELTNILGQTKDEIKRKFGIDNPEPTYQNELPVDDSVNLNRKPSPL